MSSEKLLNKTLTMFNNIVNPSLKTFNFGLIDYIVFIFMLFVSAGIGVYFGFFSKSKNTTDEYLMGSKKMKTVPVAISLVASQLSGIAIMAIPSEVYSYGFGYIFLVLSMILAVPTLTHIIVPVFYENNICNSYEYLEKRFNKSTRQLITATFLLNACLMLPVYMFIPSLAFSQVTGINIHLINTIVCSICIFYTMLGGIKAVVWTDVVQASVMLFSVFLVGVLGTIRIGGINQVLENANNGQRLSISFSLDPRYRSTFYNLFISGYFMWIGHVGLSQTCVQRIVSIPTLKEAQRALLITGIGILIIMSFNAFTGIIMFARYFGCDPILAGMVDKADKMVPFFVQDVVGHLQGIPGIFISCVFSASLSTMSAMLNSMAGIVYFDYIKPFIKHTEARGNFIMKIFVICMGCYSILGGLLVENFNSILQTIITITGINTGAVVGVFLLGMFVPRVNGKVAFVSTCFSFAVMLWIIVNAQFLFKEGRMVYTALPNTLDNCDKYNIQLIGNNSSSFSISKKSINPDVLTTAFSSNKSFSIYEISFYWYKVLGTLLVWLLALPLSYFYKSDENRKLDIKLYSPITRKFLVRPVTTIPMEEVPLKEETARKESEKN